MVAGHDSLQLAGQLAVESTHGQFWGAPDALNVQAGNCGRPPMLVNGLYTIVSVIMNAFLLSNDAVCLASIAFNLEFSLVSVFTAVSR